MTKLTQKEEFAVMKNEITHIKKDVTEIKQSAENNFTELKTMLSDHIKWESEKYNSLKNDYAGKWVEKVSVGISSGVIIAIIAYILAL